LTEPEPKKIISVRLSAEQLTAMEQIAEAMTRLSGKSVSRNDLILDAVDSFIEDAGQVLAQHEQAENPQEEQAQEQSGQAQEPDEQELDELEQNELEQSELEQSEQPKMGFGLGQTM
jgi:hypothetical protein